tara:strand:+ start:99 stop:1229 length:1131 start_codon:yes stop_codon:yes gene_type:complete
MAKAKGKKRTESVRERQRRLLRERRQITRRGSSSPTSQRVEKVKVKVEGQKQLTGSKPQGQLPPGRTGGALTRSQRIRRQNITGNQSSSSTPRQGTGNKPNRIQPRLTSRATAVPRTAAANLGAGIANVSGAISMLLAAGIISKDLYDSLRRGEGYARIPGLLKKLAENRSGSRRKGGQGGRPRANVSSNRTNNSSSSSSKSDDKTKSKSGPKEGDTKIVNNKRFVYRSGRWVNEGRPRTQAPSKSTNKDKDKGQPNNNNNRGPAPKPKPTKRTGASDPRNAAYIAARSKLNANSTKEERDKVRDMGLAIHNKTFGKKTKTSTSSKTGSTQRVNRSSGNGAPGAMSAAQREQERQRKEKEKKKKRKGRALAIGGYA